MTAHCHAIKTLALSALFLLPATSWAQQRAPVAEQIGKAYGVDSFGHVEAIRYTFSIPELKLSRSWVWEPGTDTVSYDGKDKQGNPVKVSYKRSEIDSQSDDVRKNIDPAFVNDQYVLLFPLHVAWDTCVGKNHRIEEFVYHRNGPGFPQTYTATWEGCRKAGPLLFSTEHHGTGDGKALSLMVSDVAVKTTGSGDWTSAQ